MSEFIDDKHEARLFEEVELVLLDNNLAEIQQAVTWLRGAARSARDGGRVIATNNQSVVWDYVGTLGGALANVAAILYPDEFEGPLS